MSTIFMNMPNPTIGEKVTIPTKDGFTTYKVDMTTNKLIDFYSFSESKMDLENAIHQLDFLNENSDPTLIDAIFSSALSLYARCFAENSKNRKKLVYSDYGRLHELHKDLIAIRNTNYQHDSAAYNEEHLYVVIEDSTQSIVDMGVMMRGFIPSYHTVLELRLLAVSSLEFLNEKLDQLQLEITSQPLAVKEPIDFEIKKMKFNKRRG